MKLPQTGGCQCGKLRYEITAEPQLVYTCHCTDCQRLTSSAFSLGIVVAESAFRLSGIECHAPSRRRAKPPPTIVTGTKRSLARL